MIYKTEYFSQNREGQERGVTLRAAQYRKGLFHLMNETINPGLLSKLTVNFLSWLGFLSVFCWPFILFFKFFYFVDLFYFVFPSYARKKAGWQQRSAWRRGNDASERFKERFEHYLRTIFYLDLCLYYDFFILESFNKMFE